MRLFLITSFISSILCREYIAIIDLEAIGVTKTDAKTLTQQLTSEMIEIGEYQIIERSEMKRLMEEQKFQYSGCTDIKCAVDIGKMIGAKYMVVGGVSKVGSTYSIDSRMISVESGESYISASFNHKGEIESSLAYGKYGILTGSAEKVSGKTFYSNYGDFIARISIFISISMILILFVTSNKKDPISINGPA